ncbi:rod shape determining protein RodA [Methylomagnum ishizawai]|uniref:Peptidoglycan glycosyltransferase MrdB n=1 Tax=Methylomagnum ishizawai TaxID=1760988 RepID=A0A1Y6CUU3_9GAMM|nr:rod shape-determining protein RodA [Methylomagnum ishizawai]SMF94056.1 rod shape determining protein RodA [Methylomagnum ishizawai]
MNDILPELRLGPARRGASPLSRLHIDLPLMGGLGMLAALAMVILYSSSGQSLEVLLRQAARLALATGIMLAVAQIHPRHLKFHSPALYLVGVTLLALVLLMGKISMGAQRWLDLGVVRFQPSELTKLSTPMMIAWYLSNQAPPPNFKHLLAAGFLILLPTLMIAKQPDLGTAVLVGTGGAAVVFLAGLPWIYLLGLAALGGSLLPVVWHFMHGYQRDRVLTFLNPEADPLGRGYHIIQSKIAIGSGGVYGKGWLHGTQAHLEFLPERSTDFIFAVFAEEFGLLGCAGLLAIYLFILGRCLYIVMQAPDRYSRYLAGALTLTFFVYVFVNIGMVIGILPVVGVPLPLVSYGGTSMVTLLAGFGMLMSIQTHQRRNGG